MSSGGDALAEENSEQQDSLNHEKYMPVADHLEELRRRIWICIICWVAASIAAFYRSGDLLNLLRSVSGEGFVFIFTKPTEAFMALCKMSMTVGLFVSSPILLWQFLLFVLPALTNSERRKLFLIVPFASALFAGGVVFAWYVALPVTWKFFLGFQSDGVKAMWSIGDAVGFAVGLLLLCGAVFELPLALIFLAHIGFVNADMLRRFRRPAYLLAFVLAAVVTPTPDAFTATVVAVPLIGLFELSILIIRITKKEDDNKVLSEQ
ncbi:MAG: twin-arginine translocase subunit TatC [bacterium]|nr:twin-arginine translocase subunit TatC [bacterium]